MEFSLHQALAVLVQQPVVGIELGPKFALDEQAPLPAPLASHATSNLQELGVGS